MTTEEVLELFKQTEAYLEGHFLLSSGLHSKVYLQCARVLMNPKNAELVCDAFIKKLKKTGINEIDLVVSPAMGGVIVGYEVARQLGVDEIFTERVDNKMMFRRGFTIEEGTRVLMMEDVVTTGLSSGECIQAVNSAGGNVIAAGCLINRSGGRADLSVPLVSLATIDAPLYKADALPSDLQDVPAIKPGSRIFKS